MIFAIITLLVALSIAATAATFAVIGIVMIFAASPMFAAIMGITLECGKLITASWLYRNWKSSPFFLKTYLTLGLVVLMFITSMGIYGFLSRAHMEHSFDSGNVQAEISQIETRIERQQRIISGAERQLNQLDEQIETLIEYDRISGPDGARAVRENQGDEREELNAEIDNAQDLIAQKRNEKSELERSIRELELELGPVIYIGALFVDDIDDRLDEVVRYVILIFIFVFDPLAIALIIAANHSFMKRGIRLEGDEFDDDPPPTPSPPPRPSTSNLNTSKKETTSKEDTGFNSKNNAQSDQEPNRDIEAPETQRVKENYDPPFEKKSKKKKKYETEVIGKKERPSQHTKENSGVVRTPKAKTKDTMNHKKPKT